MKTTILTHAKNRTRNTRKHGDSLARSYIPSAVTYSRQLYSYFEYIRLMLKTLLGPLQSKILSSHKLNEMDVKQHLQQVYMDDGRKQDCKGMGGNWRLVIDTSHSNGLTVHIRQRTQLIRPNQHYVSRWNVWSAATCHTSYLSIEGSTANLRAVTINTLLSFLVSKQQKAQAQSGLSIIYSAIQ